MKNSLGTFEFYYEGPNEDDGEVRRYEIFRPYEDKVIFVTTRILMEKGRLFQGAALWEEDARIVQFGLGEGERIGEKRGVRYFHDTNCPLVFPGWRRGSSVAYFMRVYQSIWELKWALEGDCLWWHLPSIVRRIR